MKSNLLSQVSLLTILGVSTLVSCQDSDVVEYIVAPGTSNSVTDFCHTYKMTLNPDSVSTRANGDNWTSTDTLYITFQTSTGRVLGKAGYNPEDDSWTINTDGTLEDGYNCSIAYFENLPANSVTVNTVRNESFPIWEVMTDQFTGIYRISETRYYLTDDVVGISGSFNQQGQRLRFKGEPGTTVQLCSEYGSNGVWFTSRIQLSPNWLWSDDNYTSDGFSSLTVGQDGFTPYIYFSGIEESSENHILLRVNGGEIFAHKFNSGMYNNGNYSSVSSANLTIPTEKNKGKWDIARQSNDFLYLLTDSTLTATAYRYVGEPKNTVQIANSVFADKDYTVTSIGSYLMSNNTGVEEVIMPESIEVIGDHAFRNTRIKNVVMPSNLKRIGKYAFEDCYNIQNIELNDGLEVIEEAAFRWTSMRSLRIPGTVKYVGHEAFYNNNSLRSLEICEGATGFDGNYTFGYSENLSYAKLPSTMTSIRYSSFYYCRNLGTIELGQTGNDTINSRAFEQTKIRSLRIPEGTKVIGFGVFSYCSELRTLDLPSTITSIDYNFIDYDYSLTKLIVRAKDIPNTSSAAFSNFDCSACTLYVPAGSVEKYKAASPWSNFGDNIVAIPEDESELADNWIDTNIKSLEFDTNGESADVKISSSTAWTAKFENNEGYNTMWVSMSQASGDGDATVSISASENDTESPRSVTIILTDEEGNESRILVRQKNKIATFKTDVLSFSLAEAGASKKILLTSSYEWTAESNSSWLTLDKTSGSGDSFITATAASNAGGAKRSAIITVNGPDGRTIRITAMQDGTEATLSASSERQNNVPVAGNSYTISFATNTTWNAETTSDWCKLSTTSGSGDGSITVTIDENKTYGNNRMATVLVRAADKVISFNFTQEYPAAQFSLDKNVVEVSSLNSDYISVFVTSNCNWRLKQSEYYDWTYTYEYRSLEMDGWYGFYSHSELNYNGSAEVKFRVQQDRERTGREAKYIFTDQDGNEYELTIKQTPKTILGRDDYNEDERLN